MQFDRRSYTISEQPLGKIPSILLLIPSNIFKQIHIRRSLHDPFLTPRRATPHRRRISLLRRE